MTCLCVGVALLPFRRHRLRHVSERVKLIR
jgi:hypothetical protein